MKIDEIKRQLAPIFKKRQVALAYLFGSRVHGRVTPLSDVDVAVAFADAVPKSKQFDLELSLMADIGRVFEVERVDIVNLKRVKEPLIKHRAVFYGRPLFVTDETRRFELERIIRREYEDTKHLRETQYAIMRQQLAQGIFGKPEIYVSTR